MGRYDKTKFGKSKANSLRSKSFVKYNTTIYEKIPTRDDDQYVIAQEGDRLDNLATIFYGDPSLWWYIAQANSLKTFNVPAGTSLRIPTSTDFAKGN